MIKPNDISVVVQGPIAGKPDDSYEVRLTLRCLESVREHLPGAEIILSTWRGANVSGLSYDVLVESDDPGALSSSAEPDHPVFYNANRQIVCTKAGLLAATKPYAMKLRSDMLLTTTGFLNFFGKYEARNEKWKILKDRVVTCTFYSRNPRRKYPHPFHPSDWFHFGRREDVLNIWDIPLAPEPETSRWYDTHPHPPNDPEPMKMFRYSVEQYTWVTFLRKHGEVQFDHKTDVDHDAINVSELTIANNLVLVEAEELQLKFIKYPVSKTDWATLYTHGEWLRLYKKYCDPGVRCPPDLVLWRKRALAVGYESFAAMESAVNNSDFVHRTCERWKDISPGSYRLARSGFRVARNLTVFQKAGKQPASAK